MIDFKDKVVYLPKEVPTESKIWEYFMANFQSLGLKKLITAGADYVHTRDAEGKSSSVGIVANERNELLKEVDIVVARLNKDEVEEMKSWVGNKDYIFKVGKNYISNLDIQQPKKQKKNKKSRS
jgi:hypothetical protein